MTIKNIIEELENIVPSKNKDRIIEQRAINVITSAINVLDLIKETYGEEQYEDLTKKMFLAIKSKEIKKFSNKIKIIVEGTHNENK